nr:hypothetical protein [Tanacetum cinerariifolium]
MTFEQSNSKPEIQCMTSGQISLGLDLPYAPSTITTQKTTEGELDLLFESMYDDHVGGQPSSASITILTAQAPRALQAPMASTITADSALTPTNSFSQATISPSTSQNVDELKTQQQHGQPPPATIADNVSNSMFDDNTSVNPFATPFTSAVESSSSQYVDPSNMHTFYQPTDGDMCMFALTVSTMEPKNVKEAITDPAWIESMQEELLQFKRINNPMTSTSIKDTTPTPTNSSSQATNVPITSQVVDELNSQQQHVQQQGNCCSQKIGSTTLRDKVIVTLSNLNVTMYAKSRPNGKLIHNSIINGLYVRWMIPEPGDPNREVHVNETFHVQTDDELTEKELKQIESDDQAIQTILLSLPEDIYAAVDSCETAQEIWLHVQQMMKGSNIGIQEKKAKLFNEWESFTSNDGESIESYYHCFLKLMNDLKRNKHFSEKISNITYPTTAMNMAIALMAKAFKLNYSTPTNNNQRISSNPHNRQIAQPGMKMGQDGQMQMVGVDLDEIEEVNANCILMANLQQASTSGNQIDKALVYDSDGSAENDNNVISEDSSVEQIEKVNTVNRELRETNAELTTELARFKNQKKCFEISQEKNDKLERCYKTSVYQEQCLSKMINALHLSFGKQIMTLNEEISYLNKQLSMEKSPVSSLLEEKKRLKSDFKIREDELLDKQIQLEKRIMELDNILVKTGQSIQTIHMLSPKPDSFYHTEQKMALGYQNSFYLKQDQSKQQILYNRKVLLEKHDPPVVHNSEATLQLAQEKTHNWSSSAHQELHKIIKDEIFPIVNHVDARVQNFEIQFLKEAAKFVRDFKSLAKEADESLAKHKALELEIERLLRVVVSQDIISVVHNNSIDETSNLQTELERTKERFENCIIKKENKYAQL